jgi:AcrR family transcriptional regulator
MKGMGLREFKKAKTRKMISEVATDLFIKRGYNEVTMADIAAAAEVSVSTVFNYFPTKESLVFDLEDEIDADIIATLRNRKKDQSILDALHHYFLSSQLFNPPNKKHFLELGRLIRNSPELGSYLRGLWGRYENSLAKEIESSVDKLEAECIAKLVFEGVSFACNSASPKEVLNLTFKILKKGWNK